MRARPASPGDVGTPGWVRPRWEGTWRALGHSADPVEIAPLLAGLLARYAEPHRAYHTLVHLEECFGHWAAVRGLADRPGEVELALWYHDAVYDTHRDDNEARSAALARAAITGARLATAVGDRVEALILATRHDGTPLAGDAALLADVDLAILAAPAERFDEYERQVHAEYAWVPQAIFRSKRRAILEAFLARAHIYASAPFRASSEASARANLARSLARLTD
ncbi:MAG: N-methyl-D-aspartate receptor NMDAR2C subunit [Gemmatimonadota bacterium]|nr:N-methyl-D-aspartate receptor NMDAR2C subunit [Gemmatimonadota bacterium]